MTPALGIILRTQPRYLLSPGVSGNYASTPNTAALQITGDIDIRCYCAMDTWTPAAATFLVAKDVQGGAVRAYAFYVRTDGRLSFSWSTTGTGGTDSPSSVATGFSPFYANWVRATLVVATGTTTFYTSSDGAIWTQLGTTVVTGATSIFAGTSVLAIGANSAGNSPLAGKVLRAQVYNGIAGTVAFDSDFTTQNVGTLSLRESSANKAVVTVNQTGGSYARIAA